MGITKGTWNMTFIFSKNKQDQLNNANSAFILTNILISRVYQSGQSGLIGQGGPGGPGSPGCQVVRVVRVVGLDDMLSENIWFYDLSCQMIEKK